MDLPEGIGKILKTLCHPFELLGTVFVFGIASVDGVLIAEIGEGHHDAIGVLSFPFRSTVGVLKVHEPRSDDAGDNPLDLLFCQFGVKHEFRVDTNGGRACHAPVGVLVHPMTNDPLDGVNEDRLFPTHISAGSFSEEPRVFPIPLNANNRANRSETEVAAMTL